MSARPITERHEVACPRCDGLDPDTCPRCDELGEITVEITWTPITCVEADALRPGLKPYASLTDTEGTFGEPTIYTEWGTEDGAVLRDWRYPAKWDGLTWDGPREPDVRPCEHMQASAPVPVVQEGGDA